uniref:Uncharacterized protein n=1 Tax=Setaria italica TaxID=4555 RepID=K3Z158_SETIT
MKGALHQATILSKIRHLEETAWCGRGCCEEDGWGREGGFHCNDEGGSKHCGIFYQIDARGCYALGTLTLSGSQYLRLV